MTKHHEVGPSSWPAVLECAAFESAPGNRDTAAGDVIDTYVGGLVRSDGTRPESGMSPADIADCEWAADEIISIFKRHGVDREHIRVQESLALFDNEENLLSHGTCDFEGGYVVVDLKSCLDYELRNKNYRPQLAGYSLMKMQRDKINKILAVEVHVKPRKVIQYWAPWSWATAIADLVIMRKSAESPRPRPCNYCHLCRKAGRCSAVVRTVEMIGDVFNRKIDAGYDSDPATIAAAFVLSKKVVKPWIDRIEKTALQTMIDGKELPYTAVRTRPGKSTITDHEAALGILDIPQSDYLSAMSVSIPKLAEAYARKRGIITSRGNIDAKSAASEIRGLLDKYIETGAPSQYLVPVLEKKKKR